MRDSLGPPNKNVKKVFYLPREDQYLNFTYDRSERWYQENENEDKETIQSAFLIDRTLVGRRVGKEDMTRSYMKDDIG